MKKANHIGLRVHATCEEKLFVGPRAPTATLGVCGRCGAPKARNIGCVPCARISKRAYKKRHPAQVSAAASVYKKAQHAAKASERAEKKAAKRASRAQRRRDAQRTWKVSNRGAVNASTARRFAAKLHATPSWANKFFIDEAYALAVLRTELFGFPWEVDHRVPLRSRLVCGLHVENNLRVIPAAENLAKSNRHWPGMWGAERMAA